jgi:hypothetical protein
VAFRPGSAQLWFFLNQRLYVVSPDGSLSFVDRQVQTHLHIEPLGASGSPTLASGEGRWQVLPIFSADGARWLFRGEDGRVRLGDANHPEDEGGPVVASSDLGGNTEIYELAPGGPLAVIRAVLGTRRDLHLVEAPWQSTRLLLADLATVTFGAGRALAVARKSQGGGDLLLVDLVTGDETRLGQNVVQAALAPACPGCDPTAPGTILAYVVQARVPYRLDGLWLGTLP